jgi:hypothetical protein
VTFGPHHLYGEAGSPEAKDESCGNCELVVIGNKIAPILVALHSCCSGLAKIWEISIFDLAPFCAPLIPLQVKLPWEIDFFVSGDPSDAAREGISFDARGEIVAAEGYIGYYSNKVLAHVCKNSHTSHGVWCEV